MWPPIAERDSAAHSAALAHAEEPLEKCAPNGKETRRRAMYVLRRPRVDALQYAYAEDAQANEPRQTRNRGVHPGARTCGKRALPFNAAESANVGDYTSALLSRLHAIVPALAAWSPPGSPIPSPPSPPAPRTRPDLSTVRGMQTALNELGASPPLVVDGFDGPLTRAAMDAFAREALAHALDALEAAATAG